jgi:hypothetical protein
MSRIPFGVSEGHVFEIQKQKEDFTMFNPFEEQQKFFKAWSDSMGMKIPGLEGMQKMYADMMPGFDDYWKKWSDMTPKLEDYAKLWGARIPGIDVYNKMYDFWKGAANPAEFMKNFQDNYGSVMNQFYKNILPEGSMGLFEKPQELLDTCVKFYQSVMSPWMKVDDSVMERIAAGDKTAYMDFFKDIGDKYEETFGKIYNMMGLGINRESNGEQMKAVDCYYKMLFSAGKLAAIIINSSTDSLKLLVSKYQSMISGGQSVSTFRDFYELWYKVNEDALIALFNTEEFSVAFCDFSDKYSKYLIAMNAVWERTLSSLPIPTKKDMDSLYYTVYTLRKDVRDLKAEVAALKEKYEGGRE